MTRWARSGNSNKKKPEMASPWQNLKKLAEEDGKHKEDKLENKTKFKTFEEKDEKREQRRLKRIDKRETSKVCFNCREPGHGIAECPQIQKDLDQGTGICFKCGSTEHASAKCKARVPAGKYPYAKCFICGEQGHLSKQCPDNPRGLYPNGGSCKICGSVEHFKKDCPELQSQEGIEDEKLDTVERLESADADPTLDKKKEELPVKKGPKIVKF